MTGDDELGFNSRSVTEGACAVKRRKDGKWAVAVVDRANASEEARGGEGMQGRGD